MTGVAGACLVSVRREGRKEVDQESGGEKERNERGTKRTRD